MNQPEKFNRLVAAIAGGAGQRKQKTTNKLTMVVVKQDGKRQEEWLSEKQMVGLLASNMHPGGLPRGARKTGPEPEQAFLMVIPSSLNGADVPKTQK